MHSFFFSKYINHKTIVFTKYIDSPPIEIPKNVDFQEIGYTDIPFKKENEKGFRLLSILLSKIYGEFIFLINILKYIKKEKYKIDLIHLHTIHYLFTSIILKKLFHVPIVLQIGGTDLFRLRKFRLLKKIIKRVDRVVYVARSMESELKNIFPKENLVHIGNGVDLNNFSPKNIQRENLYA